MTPQLRHFITRKQLSEYKRNESEGVMLQFLATTLLFLVYVTAIRSQMDLKETNRKPAKSQILNVKNH